jgi:hypothetical protein
MITGRIVRILFNSTLSLLLFSTAGSLSAFNIANNSFEKGEKEPQSWVTNNADKSCMSLVKGGIDGQNCLQVATKTEQEVRILSETVILDQQTPKALVFGCYAKADNKVKNWKFGLILADIINQDGSKVGWQMIKFNSSGRWQSYKKIWHPEKAVKQLKIMICVANPGTLQIDKVFCREMTAKDKELTKKMTFSKNPTNLVPDGGFEFGEIYPENWIPVYKKHPLYNKYLSKDIDVVIDRQVKLSGNSSLRLSNSKHALAGVESTVYSVIDDTKTFEFSGFIKAEKATGTTFLEILWLRNWMPMGYGWVTEKRNYGSYWSLVEPAGFARSEISSGTHPWKKFSVRAKAPQGANLVRFRIWSMNNSGRIWVDDLNFDGFGIDPVEIMLSQAGYPVNGSKNAVIRTKTKIREGTFALIDADTGKVVFSDKLKYYGKYQWNRHNWIADFSEFRKTGRVKLKVTLGQSSFESNAFTISNDFYDKLARKINRYFQLSRCGADVPGFHKACHLDDGQIRSTDDLSKGGKVIGFKSMSGGWHDAGDYDKYPTAECLPILALSEYSSGADNPELKNMLLDEAAWGAKHLLKCQVPDGRVYYKVVWRNKFGQCKMFYEPPENETDNIKETKDDRTITGPGYDCYTPLALTGLARFTKDQKLCREAVSAALLRTKAFLGCASKTKSPGAALAYFSPLMWANINLYELTKDKKYADSAEKFSGIILNALKKADWNAPVNSRFGSHPYPYAFMLALETFALKLPGQKITEEIKINIRMFIDKHVAADLDTLFGIKPLPLLKSPLLKERTRLSNTKVASLASILALASVIFNEPGYLRQADRLLYFVLGVNPLGMSMISGIGWKTNAVMAWSSCIQGYQNGTAVPGSVTKGIFWGNGKRKISANNLYNGYYYYNVDHPEGFPFLTVAGKYPVMGGPGQQEVWEIPTGAMLLALHNVKKAHKYFSAKK